MVSGSGELHISRHPVEILTRGGGEIRRPSSGNLTRRGFQEVEYHSIRKTQLSWHFPICVCDSYSWKHSPCQNDVSGTHPYKFCYCVNYFQHSITKLHYLHAEDIMVVSESRVIKGSILLESFVFAYSSVVKLSWFKPPLPSTKFGTSKLKTVLTPWNKALHGNVEGWSPIQDLLWLLVENVNLLLCLLLLFSARRIHRVIPKTPLLSSILVLSFHLHICVRSSFQQFGYKFLILVSSHTRILHASLAHLLEFGILIVC